MASSLDGNQTLQGAYVDENEAFRVTQLAQLVPEIYDSIALTYVAAGNGVGEIESLVYSSNGTVVATLTLSYDASNRLINVSRS